MDKEIKPEANEQKPEVESDSKSQQIPEIKTEATTQTTSEVKPEAQFNPKSGKKTVKITISILAIIFLLGGGVLGYGFFKGLQTKNYAAKIESIYNASKGKWNPDDLETEKYDEAKEFSEKMNVIKDDSSSALDEISKLRGNSKTKSLGNNTKDYYSKAKQYAESGIVIADYVVVLEDVQKYFEETSKSSPDTSSFAALAVEYKKIQKDIDDQVENLKKTVPPESFKKFNDDLINILEDFSSSLDKLILALDSQDLNKMQSAMTDLEKVATDFYSIDMPSSNDIEKDLASKDQRGELSSLGDKIVSEITNLKKKVFVLF